MINKNEFVLIYAFVWLWFPCFASKGTDYHHGVSWNKQSNKWLATRKLGGKRIHGDLFDDLEEAMHASDKLVLEYEARTKKKSPSKLNFPPIDLQLSPAPSRFQKVKFVITKFWKDYRWHCYNYGGISLIVLLFFMAQLNFVVIDQCTEFSWNTVGGFGPALYRGNLTFLMNRNYVYDHLSSITGLENCNLDIWNTTIDGMGPALQKGNVAFLFVNSFIHIDHRHLSSNTASLALIVSFGFFSHVKISPLQFIFVYFFTAAFARFTSITFRKNAWNITTVGASGACRGIDGFMFVSFLLMMFDKLPQMIDWVKTKAAMIVSLIQLKLENKTFWKFIGISLLDVASLALIFPLSKIEMIIHALWYFLDKASSISENPNAKDSTSIYKLFGMHIFGGLAYIWILAGLDQILMIDDFNLLFANDNVSHISHIGGFITGILLAFAIYKHQMTECWTQKIFQISKFVSVFILTVFFLTTIFIVITHK